MADSSFPFLFSSCPALLHRYTHTQPHSPQLDSTISGSSHSGLLLPYGSLCIIYDAVQVLTVLFKKKKKKNKSHCCLALNQAKASRHAPGSLNYRTLGASPALMYTFIHASKYAYSQAVCTKTFLFKLFQSLDTNCTMFKLTKTQKELLVMSA